MPGAAGRGRPRGRVPRRGLVRAAGDRRPTRRWSCRRSRQLWASATTRPAARSTSSATELASKQALLVLDNLEQVRGAAADIGELLRRAGEDPGPRDEPRPVAHLGEQEYPVPASPRPSDLDRLGPTSASSSPALRVARPREPDGLRVRPAVRRPRRRRSSRASPSPLRTDRRRGHRRAPWRRATGDRARRGAAAVPHAGRDPRAPRGPARPSRRGAADVPLRQRSLRGAIMWSHELLDAPVRDACSSAWPCSWGASTSPAPRPWPAADGATCSTACRRSSTRASSGAARSTASRASRRWSRSASTRWSAWRRRATPRARQRQATRRRTSRSPRSSRRSSPGERQRVTLDQLEREHANFRSAIESADARGDAELAIGLTVGVWRLWQKRGYLREARTLATALVGRPVVRCRPGAHPRQGHEVLGGIIYWHGEVDGARPDYEAALAYLARARRPARDRERRLQPVVRASRWGCSRTCHPTPGSTRGRSARRGARDLSLAGRRRRRGQRVLGIGIQHYFANDLGSRRARVRSRPRAVPQGRATGRRRAGRCTSSVRPCSSSGDTERRPQPRQRRPAAVHRGGRRRGRHARARRPGRGRGRGG